MIYCNQCSHAALDSGGVWCKLFSESIWDESVASTCGEFENSSVPVLVTEKSGSPVIDLETRRNGKVSAETWRNLVFRVEIEHYGHQEQADRVLAVLQQKVRLAFGNAGKVSVHE